MKFIIFIFLFVPFVAYSQNDSLPKILVYKKLVKDVNNSPKYAIKVSIDGVEYNPKNKLLLPYIRKVPLAHKQYKQNIVYEYLFIPFLAGALYSGYGTVRYLDDDKKKSRNFGIALIVCGTFTFAMPEISNWKFRQSINTYNANRNK